MILFLLALIASDFHLELSRGACIGTCPVYRVMVDAHGAVTFEGLERLASVVQSLREPKKCIVMDTPRSTIRVRMNGRETTVHHNAGCDSTAIEDRIDEIIGIEAWKRYDARLAKRREVVRHFGGCAPGIDCEATAP